MCFTKKIKIIYLFLLFAHLSPFLGYSQLIRGKVIDQDSYQPIAGAAIRLIETNHIINTDEQGAFRFKGIETGRIQLQINSLGYKNVTIPILIEAGKELVLEIPLQLSATEFEAVMIKAPRLEVSTPLSLQSITIEETLRLPATFYDPARMMATYAGVVATNDQANHLSIRGNSPNHLIWQLEGVEIVNPNHTANAGTTTDLPTLNGGGVNMLSTQLLSDSRFYKGNFPSQYGNVVGGLLDMRLRKGNDEQHEFTGQLGLIGIDLAAEGPFSKNSKASYLVNYRYSTLGLFSKLGIELGDEEINFQDFSANISLPTKDIGTFSLFGTWGKSSNIFEGIRDTSLQTEQKETFDIRFVSDALIVGATHLIPLGTRGVWRTSIAYSSTESQRIADDFIANRINTHQLKQSKIAIHTRYNTRINTRTAFKTGLYYTQYNWQFQNDAQEYISKPGITGTYINWENKWTSRLKSNIGVHALFTPSDFLNGALSNPNISTKIQPRATLAYQINNKQSLHFAYGLHSQALPYGTLEAHQFGLNYTYTISPKTNFTTEIYWQGFFDVPQTQNGEKALNIFEINTIEAPNPSDKKARNYGIEMSLQRFITEDYYFIANATLFESQFQAEDETWLDTRWNNKYAFNLTGGKEWTKQKKKAKRIFGLNARLAYGGGFRSNPIDLTNSDAFFTRYTDINNFSQQYPAYFKLDLRLYWKRNKAKHNTMLALDIQNASNTKNVAFEYYDALQEKIVTKYQLPLIPILSWRIEL